MAAKKEKSLYFNGIVGSGCGDRRAVGGCIAQVQQSNRNAQNHRSRRNNGGRTNGTRKALYAGQKICTGFVAAVAHYSQYRHGKLYLCRHGDGYQSVQQRETRLYVGNAFVPRRAPVNAPAGIRNPVLPKAAPTAAVRKPARWNAIPRRVTGLPALGAPAAKPNKNAQKYANRPLTSRRLKRARMAPAAPKPALGMMKLAPGMTGKASVPVFRPMAK